MLLGVFIFIAVFQFYLSSIKRERSEHGYSSSIKFQFYLSSIKSHQEIPSLHRHECFNSTLVQLKGALVAVKV